MNMTPGFRSLIFIIALCAVAAQTRFAFALTTGDPCRAPDDVSGAVAALPSVAAKVQAGGVLNVLAVGSATMFGPDASLAPGTITSQSLGNGVSAPTPAKLITGPPSERAFPLQMAKALKGFVPGLEIKMTVRGGRSLQATDMLALIRAELATQHYDLVIWQTGTVEAVRNIPPGEFAQTLSEGAELISSAGANLVLVDPQYSRFLQTNSNVEPYEQGLQQVAAMPGVVLFRRYDLMRTWANDSQIDLERTPRADRQRVIDTLHACLGKHLARLVLESARS